MLGFSQQSWPHAGAAVPLRRDTRTGSHPGGRSRSAGAGGAALATHYRLRGLASVDALVAGDSVTVLELNPRPGGSLDAYGAPLASICFAVHVERLPGRPAA